MSSLESCRCQCHPDYLYQHLELSVSICHRMGHTRPTNDKTGLVTSLWLRNHVEMNVIDFLVGNAAVVLGSQPCSRQYTARQTQ